MEDLNDKVLGSNLSATEWNQVPSEIQNVIENTGQTLTNADLDQLGKGVANYVGNSNFYTDSGIANAYVLNEIPSKQSITAYTDGLTVEFLPTNTNTTSSTVSVPGLSAQNIVNTSAGGEIVAGERIRLKYRTGALNNFIIDSNDDVSLTGGNVLAPHENLVSSRASDSTIDIDADAVLLKNDSGKKLRVESINLTLDITTDLDAGSEASSTWYFIWVVSDGTTDEGRFSLSSISPSLPSNIIYKGLVGAAFNDGSSDFTNFLQNGERVSSQENLIINGGASTSRASLDLSMAIPPTALVATGKFAVSNSAGGPSVNRISPTDAPEGNTVLRGQTTTGETAAPFALNIIESQTMYYQVVNANDLARVNVTGWRF